MFVGYPATYDFMWVYDALMRTLGRSPFSFAGLDLKTLIMVAGKLPYRAAVKKAVPASWRAEWPRHSHVAVEDARGQGILFRQLLEFFRGEREWK